MKRKDIVFIAVAVLTALALYGGNMLLGGGVADEVVISVDGKETLRVPLSVDGVYSVPLPGGEINIVAVEDGAAFMQEANCRDQLCLHQGVIRRTGKQIVCLPHRVVVRLDKASDRTGEDGVMEDDLDVVVR